MPTRRSQPYIWTTWLTKLLDGSDSCEWSAWFRAHHSQYDKAPSDFDLVSWQMQHTSLLDDTRKLFLKDGYTVSIEGQNQFKLTGKTGITLASKPDLVCFKGDKGIVVDCKTGQEKSADFAQVLIYMWALPLAIPKYRNVKFTGRVVYGNGNLSRVRPDDLDEHFVAQLTALILRVGGPEPCHKVPTFRECNFCNIGASECDERVPAPDIVETETDAF
jgi:hypothetical protein